MARRGVLGLLGGIGVAAVAGCALGDTDTDASGASSTPAGADGRPTARVPVAERRTLARP